MSIVFSTVEALRDSLRGIKADVKSMKSIGLVPTMGALHAGHLSLVERAKRENNCVVVSIFVNPLQFGMGEDFSRYPRDFESDRQACQKAGVDLIFAPPAEQIYHSKEITKVVPPDAMTSVMCGRSRVDHFTGVATVVTKLLNIVQPHRAYFGQKDGQQLAIIRRTVRDLNFGTEVVACPTLRMETGLALSSRNQYLNSGQLIVAASLYKSLKLAEVVCQAGEKDGKILISVVKNHLSPQVDLEYVELVDAETLQSVSKVEKASMLAIAGRVGNTRLIDNILLNVDNST